MHTNNIDSIKSFAGKPLTQYDLSPEEMKQALAAIRMMQKAEPPEQLKEQALIRIKPLQKNPNDAWTELKNQYSFNDEVLRGYLRQGGNYGVRTGMKGLDVVDFDQPERVKELGVLDKLPETFEVKTRSGGFHFYYRCPELTKKIILYDKELKDKDGSPLHIGEIQSQGQYVVGPGCSFQPVDDKGNPLYYRDEHNRVRLIIQRWEVIDSSPIRTIEKDQLLEILSCFQFKDADDKPTQNKKGNDKKLKRGRIFYPASSREYIKIEDIAMPLNIKKDDRDGSGEIQGEHPLHGSDHGLNFSINVKKNCWHCFRHGKEKGRGGGGGGPAEWLAVEAELITCEEAKSGCLRGDVYQKVVEYARQKGLELPPRYFNPDVMEIGPKGGMKIKYRALAALLADEFSLKRVISQDVKAELKFAAYDYEIGIYKLGGEAQGLINKRCIELLGDSYSINVKANLRTYLAAAAEEIEEDGFEPFAWLINCKNGVVDLRAGQLLPWSPDYLQIFQANASFDPSAKCPKWIAFLREVLPDKELREYTNLVSGYYITGETSEQIFHIPYGAGQNGKSKWIEVQTHLLGTYARPTPISTFIKQRSQSAEKLWNLAQLRGIRWVYSSEPNLGDRLDESFIKAGTGGEKMPARFMREGLFEFQPRFKFTLETNIQISLPEGLSFAMKRRIRILPFIVQIKNINKRIAEELLEQEGNGIFTWMCMQAKAYYEKGFEKVPQAVLAAAEEYEREQDPLSGFISICLEQGKKEDFELSSSLKEAYEKHCLEIGAQPIQNPWFMRHLKKQLKEKGWLLPEDKGKINGGYGCIRGIKFLIPQPEEAIKEEHADSPAGAEDDKTVGICSYCSRIAELKMGYCQECINSEPRIDMEEAK